MVHNDFYLSSSGGYRSAAADILIQDTEVGKGVFARHDFPESAVVGEIWGDVFIDLNYESDYCIDLENGSQLEPYAPFRFLNHSCDPNCEFDWDEYQQPVDSVYLITLKPIFAGEELTIDYNWPASGAIPCKCGSADCRGWIVNPDELEQLKIRHRDASSL